MTDPQPPRPNSLPPIDFNDKIPLTHSHQAAPTRAIIQTNPTLVRGTSSQRDEKITNDIIYTHMLSWASNRIVNEEVVSIFEALMARYDTLNINEFSSYGSTMLYLACKCGYYDVVDRLLLIDGIKVYGTQDQITSNTPLHVATFNGYIEIVQLLLNSGATPEKNSKNQKFPHEELNNKQCLIPISERNNLKKMWELYNAKNPLWKDKSLVQKNPVPHREKSLLNLLGSSDPNEHTITRPLRKLTNGVLFVDNKIPEETKIKESATMLKTLGVKYESGKIKEITIPKLVDFLTWDEKDFMSTQLDAFQFLMTHTLYMTSEDLLDLLINRYSQLKSFQSKQRLLDIIKLWLNKLNVSFNEVMKQNLRKFIVSLEYPLNKFIKGVEMSSSDNLEVIIPKHYDTTKRNRSGDNISLLEVCKDILTLANAFYEKDKNLWLEVPPMDCWNPQKLKPLMDYSNDITMWAQTEILKQEELGKRIDLIEMFIDVAYSLLKVKDLCSSMAFTYAFMLFKQKEIFNLALSKSHSEKASELERIFSPERNFEILRVYIKQLSYASDLLEPILPPPTVYSKAGTAWKEATTLKKRTLDRMIPMSQINNIAEEFKLIYKIHEQPETKDTQDIEQYLLNYTPYDEHQINSCLKVFSKSINVDCIAYIVRELHRASMEGNIRVINLIKKLAAQPHNASLYTIFLEHDVSGYTALHYASMYDRYNIVKFIISILNKNGVSLDISSSGGETPLHVATRTGSRNALSLLLSAGCNMNVEDLERKKPYERTNTDAVKLIWDYWIKGRDLDQKISNLKSVNLPVYEKKQCIEKLDLFLDDVTKPSLEHLIQNKNFLNKEDGEWIESKKILHTGKLALHYPDSTQKPILQDCILTNDYLLICTSGLQLEIQYKFPLQTLWIPHKGAFTTKKNDVFFVSEQNQKETWKSKILEAQYKLTVNPDLKILFDVENEEDTKSFWGTKAKISSADYVSLGDIFMAFSNWNKAVKSYKGALKESPLPEEEFKAYFGISNSYYHLKEHEKSLKKLNKAIDILFNPSFDIMSSMNIAAQAIHLHKLLEPNEHNKLRDNYLLRLNPPDIPPFPEVLKTQEEGTTNEDWTIINETEPNDSDVSLHQRISQSIKCKLTNHRSPLRILQSFSQTSHTSGGLDSGQKGIGNIFAIKKLGQ